MNLLEFEVKSAYRNLEGLKIKFDKNWSTYVIIGTNGSGKSNILEALSSVFNTLYYDNSRNFEFSFYLKYKILSKTILLIYDKNNRKFIFKIGNKLVDGVDIDHVLSQHLPSKIVCNYSGEDSRIFERYYAESRKIYLKELIQGEVKSPLQMMFVNKDYWKIIFVTMYCCKEQVEAFDHFITSVLGVKSIDNIILDIDHGEFSKWRNSAPALYLRQLYARTEGRNITIDDFNPNEEDAAVIYNNLVGISTLIENFVITFNGGIDTVLFSEGEKKMMVVLFMLEALSDENSLLLMDEPDSHIHVARKGELVNYLTGTANRENLITSHSPSMTARFDKDAIIMLSSNEHGTAEVVDKDKIAIVKELTDGMWSIQEQNMFLNSNDDILLVEGWTDEVYISKALEVFHNQQEYKDLNFTYLPCNGSSNLQMMSEKFHPRQNQMMIALFDDDQAGWKTIRSIFNLDENADKQTFGLAQKKGDIWYALIPAKKKKLSGNFNIEDYFERNVFLKLIMGFKVLNDIKDKKTFKNMLANLCKENKLADKEYKPFGLLLDFLKQIKQAEAEGKNKI